MSGVRCNWGALFAGAVVTIACVATTMLIANGIGLSPINVIDPGASEGLRAGSWIYNCLAWLFSFFAGAFVSARIGGIDARAEGTLYGLITWALSGSLILLVAMGQSLTFRFILTGQGPMSGNWLLIAVAGLGAIAGALGGRVAWRARPGALARSPEADRPGEREAA